MVFGLKLGLPKATKASTESPEKSSSKAESSARSGSKGGAGETRGGGKGALTVNEFVARTKRYRERGLEPTKPELIAYARYLGIDPITDGDLMWIADEALAAPLPSEWTEHHDSADRVFYYNVQTHASSWTHPLEQLHRDTYKAIVHFRSGDISKEDQIGEIDRLKRKCDEAERDSIKELQAWSEHTDEGGQRFFYNRDKQVSVWTDPRPARCHSLYLQMKALKDMSKHCGQAALDAPGLPSAAAPPLLRDINSYAQASQQAYPGAPGYAAAVAAHHAPGYPPQSAQSYVGQQPYGSQQPYVSSQQAAAYSAGQYSGQQAAYAAGQQAYQTAAATASSGYGGAYPPQAQTGYGAPPGYGAQYGQPATAYPTNPTTAYATAGYGLGQSPYNYLQQPSTSASGVVAYGSYQGAQSQVPQAATSQVQYTQPGQTDPSVATGSLADQSQQQYLDMVWQLSDMSLNDKQTLPAPPNQQPPAPPAHMPAEGTAAGASTGVWNSFDDAAAKGMVDGLVGDDAAAAGAPPPLPPPPPNTAMWTSH